MMYTNLINVNMDSEWIDVNKPWIAKTEGMDNSEFPTDAIEHYCLEKYGKTITELEKLISNSRKIGNEICEKFYDEFGLSLVYHVLPSICHKNKNLEKIPELAITKALEYKQEFGYAIYPPHISCFYKDCLDYIKYKVAQNNRMDFYYDNSFCESDLCRPGVLIEVQYENGEKDTFLCCPDEEENYGGMMNDRNPTVLRAKVLYTLEPRYFLNNHSFFDTID